MKTQTWFVCPLLPGRSPPSALGRFVGTPRLAQKVDQHSKFAGFEMAELQRVAVPDPVRQLREERQPALGDADAYRPPVVGRALAIDQPSLEEPVEQSRNVRGARDELPGQREGRQ